MKVSRLLVLFVVVTLIGGCGKTPEQKQPASQTAPRPYIPDEILTTEHFTIHTSADPEHAAVVATAVETLYKAYASKFGARKEAHQLQLVLYRDQAEFKNNNLSSAWAEAYYKRPYSFAYPGIGENPYHWMLHEVAHQLLTEVGGYKLSRWLNEGMAGYLGSSTISGESLSLGKPDRSAYPIWWLREVRFDQPSKPTFSGSQIPSLEQIVEQTGPPVGENVNSYYVAWWSLAHYLMHRDGGTHHEQVLELLKNGGSPEAFRTLIGSYTDIEPQWHSHLRVLVEEYGRKEGGP